MTDTTNLIHGRPVRYVGAFNPGFSVIFWQEMNFNSSAMGFDGPCVVAFNSLEQARTWFRKEIKTFYSESEVGMFLYSCVDGNLSIEAGTEPFKLLQKGPRGGLMEWEC